MSYIPFCREDMRTLKAAKDVTIKNMKIDYLVKKIYGEALRFAETNEGTLYKFSLAVPYNIGHITVPSNAVSNFLPALISTITIENVIEYLDDILAGLKVLFPECLVKHTQDVEHTQDGFIVIDWS